MNMSLEQRLELEREKDGEKTTKIQIRGEGVSREVKFIPRDVKKKQEAEKTRRQDRPDKKGRSRRGIKELGFKKPFDYSK